MTAIMKTRIIKGDKIIIVTGNDKKFTGEIIEIHKNKDRVKVKGAHMQTHFDKGEAGKIAGLNQKEGWIHISNVALVCKDGKSTKIKTVRSEDGVKVLSRRTNEELRISKQSKDKTEIKKEKIKKEKGDK